MNRYTNPEYKRKGQEGFYCLGPYVYYGTYSKNHTSRKMSLSLVNPDDIKTTLPFSDSDFAIKLYDNRAAG